MSLIGGIVCAVIVYSHDQVESVLGQQIRTLRGERGKMGNIGERAIGM